MKFIENIYSQDVTIFKEQKIEPEGCIIFLCGADLCGADLCGVDVCGAQV